jgi:hypothetical protein
LLQQRHLASPAQGSLAYTPFESQEQIMRIPAYFRFLGLAFVFLVVPAFASAQQRTVLCESNDGNRKYCGEFRPEQVGMQRQVSGSPCISGETWGVDGRGLWVDRGCRAEFLISERPQQTEVKCESNDGHRRYCDVSENSQVTLLRQISGSPCDEGRGWGVDQRGLWVDHGCRAIFGVRAGWRGDRPGWDWWDANPNDTWPPQGEWRGGNWGRGGACFYTDRDFHGKYVCLRRGENRESLGRLGDDISSVRVFGGARVIVFDDREFRGARDEIYQDVPDLRRFTASQKPEHTWNNRISSIRIQ